MSNRVLQTALDYVQLGWPLLPLWGIQNGKCLCGKSDCGSPGKHPHGIYAPHGLKNASIEPKVIEQWFQDGQCNIGVVTGRTSGFIVLDADSEEAIEQCKQLPKTPTAQTGRGRHFLFRYPDKSVRNKVKLSGFALDVRGDGGYIVAPPSRHANGKEYKWLVDPRAKLADCPAWLLNGQSEPERSTPKTSDIIPAGKRDNTLTSMAGSMRRKGMSEKSILAALREENKRCDPPLPDKDLQKISRSIGHYEPGNKAETLSKLIIKNLAEVEMLPITFLWHNRIPLGMLTLLIGDGGLGKSFLSLYIASQVSNGRLWPDNESPDNRAPEGFVLILTAEDDLSRVVVPRLKDMGANLGRIRAIEGTKLFDENGQDDAFFSLKRDIPALRGLLQEQPDVKLIVIDPLSAYLGQRVDSYKDADVRSVLGPLIDLAEESNAAIIGIMHLNKGTGSKALYRALGSVAFMAAARTAWLVSKDPHEPDSKRRLFTPAKHNVLIDPNALAFEIVDGKVVFESEPVNMTSDEALGVGSTVEALKKDQTVAWIKEVLPSGKSLASTEFAEMAVAQGMKEGTLRRAKTEAGVKSYEMCIGGKNQWFVHIPE